MSELFDTHDESCADIEDLLVRQCHEQINGNEQALVQRHLRSCEDCRAFGEILEAIPQTLAMSCGADLQPAPAVRTQALDRMRMKHRERSGWKTLIREPLRRLTTIRVPVYQAILGVTVMAVITLIGINGRLSGERAREDSRPGTVFADTTRVHQPFALPQLDLMDSLQIRRNVREDSLLSKYYRGIHDTLLTDGRLKPL